MDILGTIKNLASEHPDQAKSLIEKGEELIEKQTGHKFDSQIEKGSEAAEKFLGTNNSAQGTQQNQQ